MKNHPLFRFLASLKLAVMSLLSLSAVLAYATVLESKYGMRASHLMVYGTWWFYGLLFFLGANVLFAALARFPWKKRQTGFVITHAGILIILGGSWLTARFGVDGSLPVVEGSQDRIVVLNDLKLTLTDTKGGTKQTYPFPESGLKRTDLNMALALPNQERIVIEGFYPRVMPQTEWVSAPLPGLGVPALEVELTSSRFTMSEWLVARHPERGGEKNLGPAALRVRKLWNSGEIRTFLSAKNRERTAADGFGTIVVAYNGQTSRVDARSAQTDWKRAGSSPFEVKVEKYLPYAVVEGKNLISRSKEPRNPAVQFLIRDPFGTVEKHTLFAFFPEFATKHRNPSGMKKDPLPVQLKYEGPEGAMAGPQGVGRGGRQGELEFAVDGSGKSYYRVFNAAGVNTASGEVEVDKSIATGWMDMKFRVTKLIPFAVERSAPAYVDEISGAQTLFLSAIQYRQERDGKSAEGSKWLVEGETKDVQVGTRTYTIGLDKEQLRLPFELFLEKFRVGTDPGTTKAASYESVVRVIGSDNRESSETTLISMNEPLKHGGFTFYQASYQMRDGQPPVSVFSVNRDPGRWVKYAGCLLMVLGIMLMFYLNPHYWDKILGGANRSSAQRA